MKVKGIGAPRDENGGMSQIPEPASAASAPGTPARRALVTGASTGIGAVTVRLLRSRGWALERPARVNIGSLIVRLRAQASNTVVARD